MSVEKLFNKRNFPVLIFAIAGLFILFSHFTGLGQEHATTLATWPTTLSNFAIILGAISMIRYHSLQVVKQKETWYYSVITLIVLLITFGSSLASKPLFDWINTNINATLSTAMTAFVGFYMYILFYRAARVRNLEITLLIVATIFIFFYMAPIGDVIHPSLTAIGKWINDVPNKGAMRGTLISIALGMIGLFVRAIIGFERAQIGGE